MNYNRWSVFFRLPLFRSQALKTFVVFCVVKLREEPRIVDCFTHRLLYLLLASCQKACSSLRPSRTSHPNTQDPTSRASAWRVRPLWLEQPRASYPIQSWAPCETSRELWFALFSSLHLRSSYPNICSTCNSVVHLSLHEKMQANFKTLVFCAFYKVWTRVPWFQPAKHLSARRLL